MLKRFLDSPLFRISVRYGLISALLCVAIVVSMYYMHKHPFLVNPFLDFRVFAFAVLLFFCLKEIRDYYQDGILHFWQGMASSLLFLSITAAFSAGGIALFAWLQPGFVTEYIEQFTTQIRNLPADTVERIGKEVIDRNLSALPATKGTDLASLYAWQTYQLGFFISIIISVILRRQLKNQ